METPLIYTTKGNLPIASLAYNVEWSENDDEVTMAEVYKHENEIVRRSVHVHKKHGVVTGAKQAIFG
jgi:hypothetical protein